MIEISSFVWFFGWMLTAAYFVYWKHNEHGAFGLISRCLLLFFFWPFLLFMGHTSKFEENCCPKSSSGR